MSFPTQLVVGSGRFRTNRTSCTVTPQGVKLETHRNKTMAVVKLCMVSESNWTNCQHRYFQWMITYKRTTLPPSTSQLWKSVEAGGVFRGIIAICLVCYYILLWPSWNKVLGWLDSGLDKDSHSWVFMFHASLCIGPSYWVSSRSSPRMFLTMLTWNEMNLGTLRHVNWRKNILGTTNHFKIKISLSLKTEP